MVDDLGDVGGVVAAALDVLGDEEQMRAQADRARVFHHVGEKFAEQAVVDLVDLGVLLPHRFGRFGVAVGIGVEHVLELRQSLLAHARERRSGGSAVRD